jgi:5'-3' exonuclease
MPVGSGDEGDQERHGVERSGDDPSVDPPVTLLAVDGNSLAHRAFHASAPDERDGAWMCDMVVRIVAGVWSYGPYDAVVVGFDHDVNDRKLADPGYKAGRSEKDPQLVDELARLPGQLDRIGWTVVSVRGAEADDVLATVATGAATRGWRTVLLSSDRDLTAQVAPLVTLLRPRGSMSDLVVTDPDRVRAEYGVDPEQYVDFAAMRGDVSDGLPGVHGIGPKTAARLLRDHGSVDELYRNLHNLLPATEARLRAGREQVDRNLTLMTPLTTLPLDLDDVLRRGVDVDAWAAALVDLGLGRAAGTVRRALTDPGPPPAPPPPTDDDAPVVAPRRRALVPPATEGEQDSLF